MVTHNEQGLLLCWNFIMFSLELKPNKIIDDEVKNKSRIELHAIRYWSIDTTTAKTDK
jgi:hypothetical protein